MYLFVLEVDIHLLDEFLTMKKKYTLPVVFNPLSFSNVVLSKDLLLKTQMWEKNIYTACIFCG